MKRTFKNIAYVIKAARVKRGISQVELAKSIGYKNGQFASNMERGLCSLPLKKIDLTAKILDIHPSEIKDAMMTDYHEHLQKA